MKKLRHLFIFLSLSLFITSTTFAQENRLWFRSPASNWNEALPIGNGRLGAMVFGGTANERLQLNEESVWSRADTVTDRKGAYKWQEKTRKLLFADKYAEAQELYQQNVMGDRLPSGTNSYQTLGDLSLQFSGVDNYSGYRRELLLDSALTRTSFVANRARHTRTCFSSAADQSLVFRATADKKGQISCKITLTRPGDGEVVEYSPGRITMKQHVSNGKGVRYETRLLLTADGGTMTAGEDGIQIAEANSFEVRLVAATDYRGEEPALLCDQYEQQIKGKSYNSLLANHVKNYQALFNRVSLQLPSTEAAKLSTDDRLYYQQIGMNDPSFSALYFQFGRYLLISSSREGCLPANLQGLWADGLVPPWNADYHININIQMNYWPAEVTNLSECHLPFLRFIDELRENGRKTAKEIYGVKGFTAHHTTDAWHFTTLFGHPQYGAWPMGAAWSATHLWEHYQFTGDKEFLRNFGYPIMREAALFLSQWMVKNPTTGKWVTGPSMSPENTFVTPDGQSASICMGPAMDLQIVRFLFNDCIEASRLLNTDASFRRKMEKQLADLTPVNIGSDGRILEWSDERLTETEPGHRHISHLFGIHPANIYTWEETPEYMEAAGRSLQYRLNHGGGHTGWSRAWITNFYARLLDGEKAYESLNALYTKSTLPNMFDNHPPFQIDGNFGATAAIAEMLLQSHTSLIDLLPALPKAWHTGKVSGLCARGGFQIDMEWSNGEMKKVVLHSKLGNPCTLRYGKQTKKFTLAAGESIILNHNLQPQ